MTDQHFNALINGPLNHPLPMFRLARLTMALRILVESIGEEAEDVLERHCYALQRRDEGYSPSDN